MRSNIVGKAFAALGGMMLLVVGVFGQDAGKPKSGDTELTVKKPQIKKNEPKKEVLFPEIEGWTRSEKTTYPSAGLGYSYTYTASEGGRVTIYVYDMNNAEISDNLNDPLVKGEFESAKRDIQSLGRNQTYPNLKENKTEIITIGNKTKSHFVSFNFDVQGRTLTSELYVFSYKNNFIKIRATRPKSEEKSEEFFNLLAEIIAMFED